jgi:alpha-beta hydrolase superfamily lysophospholipase
MDTLEADNPKLDQQAYYASQAAYGSEKYHRMLQDEGYQLDPSLSSYRYKTYVGQQKTLVAFKGTDPYSLIDLDADVAIAIGTQKKNPEFKTASEIVKRAKSKYGSKVITTGHSLGGTKAIESANDHGLKAIVFNPGTGLREFGTRSHTTYIKKGDVISSRVKGENIKISKGSHSLNSFEPDFQSKIKVY